MPPSTTIIHADVFDALPALKPGSIDCVVTSPPYWQLRSYLPKNHPLKHLEIGSEPTPKEYVEKMVRVFRLVREAMANHATCWLNVGDSYSGTGKSGGGKQGEDWKDRGAAATKGKGTWEPPPEGIDAGNLCLIPQRLAIALQDDGWFVRSVIVWHKPSAMPASLSGWSWRRHRIKVKGGNQTGSGKQATNRLTAGFNERYHGTGQPDRTQRVYDPEMGGQRYAKPEWKDCPGCPKCSPNGGLVLRKGSWRPTSSWEPLLMLAKSPDYFADGEPVKTTPAAATVSRDLYTRVLDDPDEQFAVKHDHETTCAGANLRDVWTIGAEPLNEKHYAAFPTELVLQCLRAGTSERGYCPKCGAPWVRVLDVHREDKEETTARCKAGVLQEINRTKRQFSGGEAATESFLCSWRPSCRCPPEGIQSLVPRPAVVLDPFSGSGRTGVAAKQLGLDFVGIDLNEHYVEMAERQIAGALREDLKRVRPKPDEPDLFARMT